MLSYESPITPAAVLARQGSFNTLFNNQLKEMNIIPDDAKIDVRGLETELTLKAYSIHQAAQSSSSAIPDAAESSFRFEDYINFPPEGPSDLSTPSASSQNTVAIHNSNLPSSGLIGRSGAELRRALELQIQKQDVERERERLGLTTAKNQLNLATQYVEPPSQEAVNAPGFLGGEGQGCVDMAVFLANQGPAVQASSLQGVQFVWPPSQGVVGAPGPLGGSQVATNGLATQGPPPRTTSPPRFHHTMTRSQTGLSQFKKTCDEDSENTVTPKKAAPRKNTTPKKKTASPASANKKKEQATKAAAPKKTRSPASPAGKKKEAAAKSAAKVATRTSPRKAACARKSG